MPSFLALRPQRVERAILEEYQSSFAGSKSLQYALVGIPIRLVGAKLSDRGCASSATTRACTAADAATATGAGRAAAATRRWIVAISDTHNLHGDLREVPDGDVLIHCGDGLRCGGDEEAVRALGQWLASQPHAVKVVTGGNHDATLEMLPRERIAELLGSDALRRERRV